MAAYSHVLGPSVDSQIMLDQTYDILEVIGGAAFDDLAHFCSLFVLLGHQGELVKEGIHLGREGRKYKGQAKAFYQPQREVATNLC